MPPRREPKRWERQLGETSQAYAAFVIYRDMGPNRNLEDTAQKLGKSKALCQHFKSKWDWEDRVEAWVDRLDNVKRSAIEAEIEEMGRKQALAASKMMDMAIESIDMMTPKDLARKPTSVANASAYSRQS